MANERARQSSCVLGRCDQWPIDMDQIIGCIQSGADDYLLKPFNPVLLQPASPRESSASDGMIGKRIIDTNWSATNALSADLRSLAFGRYRCPVTGSAWGLELGGDLREVTIMMSISGSRAW